MRAECLCLTRSLVRRYRQHGGGYRYRVPVISPQLERLKTAALGGHTCHVFTVRVPATGQGCGMGVVT